MRWPARTVTTRWKERYFSARGILEPHGLLTDGSIPEHL
jgi:hypothetical protein